MKRLLVVSFIIGLLSAFHALSTEPERNIASPTQYYAAPPTQYSDPLVELQRQGAIRDSFISYNRGMTQNTIDWMRANSSRPR
jgi:hypothetical protein